MGTKNGWTLGRIAGIDITVHWSFGLLLLYVAYGSLSRGGGWNGAIAEIGFVAAAFGCVVLHELGHALAARGFGIRTHGITLLPIGGVANLESIPRDPFQELVITIAGPMVNVLIAGVLTPIVLAFSGVQSLTSVTIFGGAFLARMLYFNIAMILFNLLPAFPMDGGRMLRACLAFFQPYLKATEWAVKVSRVFALLLLAAGLFGNPFLMLIAMFVFLAGNAELQRLRMETTVTRWPTAWTTGHPVHGTNPATGVPPVVPPTGPTFFVVHGPRGEQTKWVIER